MLDNKTLSPVQSPHGSPPRPPGSWFRSPTTHMRLVVLGLGVSAPVFANDELFNDLSLPLLFAVVGSVAAIGSAVRLHVLPRLRARVAARRRDAVLVRRLARLCCMGDFPHRQERVFDLVAFLACEASLSRSKQKLLATASTLHRIGLVSLPPCSAGDHDQMARRAVEIAERLLSGPTALHRAATGMALSHEESWDGGGQPLGLSGQAIPFSARLLQVALALDALLPRTGYVPDRNTLAGIAARIRAEGGRTLDPMLAALPSHHLDGLECLLRSRLMQPVRSVSSDARDSWWSRTARFAAAGSMLTPA